MPCGNRDVAVNSGRWGVADAMGYIGYLWGASLISLIFLPVFERVVDGSQFQT
jgi:hypothetical protein